MLAQEPFAPGLSVGLLLVVLATLGWLTRNGDRVTQVAIGKMAGLDSNTNAQALPAVEAKDADFFNSLTNKEKNQLMRIFQKLTLIKQEVRYLACKVEKKEK